MCYLFHICSGRLAVESDILSSMLNSRSANSSSIIAAYWPTRGSATLEANTSKNVIGQICYSFTHSVTLKHPDSTKEIVNFTLGFVDWLDDYHVYDLFGISTIVCANMTCHNLNVVFYLCTELLVNVHIAY